MNFILDIGNTIAKNYFVVNNQIVTKTIFEYKSVTDFNPVFFETVLTKNPEILNVIISSVIGYDFTGTNQIKKMFKNVICLNRETNIPLENLYETPHTLGYDRIAAAVGATVLFPANNILVIDFGTAITIDFVNNKNQFTGGNISPGMNLRFKALHHFTAKLPLLEKKENWNLTGKNTNDAIVSGVMNSIVFEIEQYIKVYSNLYPDLKIIFTGGDSIFFAEKLKNTIFAEPNLVAIGLNRILNYNV